MIKEELIRIDNHIYMQLNTHNISNSKYLVRIENDNGDVKEKWFKSRLKAKSYVDRQLGFNRRKEIKDEYVPFEPCIQKRGDDDFKVIVTIKRVALVGYANSLEDAREIRDLFKSKRSDVENSKVAVKRLEKYISYYERLDGKKTYVVTLHGKARKSFDTLAKARQYVEDNKKIKEINNPYVFIEKGIHAKHLSEGKVRYRVSKNIRYPNATSYKLHSKMFDSLEDARQYLKDLEMQIAEWKKNY